MKNEDGKLYYGIGLDNSQLRNDARESSNILHGIGDSADRESQRMDNSFKKMGAAIAAAFSIQQLTAFGKKVLDVRGEMDSLQRSFVTLAGRTKGMRLFEDIKDFAVHTPMLTNTLAKGAHTLLPY